MSFVSGSAFAVVSCLFEQVRSCGGCRRKGGDVFVFRLWAVCNHPRSCIDVEGGEPGVVAVVVCLQHLVYMVFEREVIV